MEDLLTSMYFGNTLTDYIRAMGIVFASVIVGKIVYYVINKYVKKLTEETETNLDDLLVDALEEPVIVAIVAGGLYVASQTLVIPASVTPTIYGLITAIFILDAVWLAIRIIDIVIKEILLPITSKTDSTLDDQLIPLISKGIKAIVVVLGVLVILSKFGIDITALVAGLGIGGLAIALASKDTVENMFGAFAILLDRPFVIRDRIIVEGVTGDVVEVGLRSTRLITQDHTELYIPNAKVVTTKIENISRPDQLLVKQATINVTCETSSQKLKEGISIIKSILAQTNGVVKERAPTVVFKEFGDSSLEIYLKYWVSDYLRHHEVTSDVNMQIKERFEAAGIEFAYPTQKVLLSK